MNRMSWLLVVPLALVSAVSVPAGCVEFDTYFYDTSPNVGGAAGTGGTGGDGGTGGTGGTPLQCMTVDQCPDSPECRIGGMCNEGTCEWATVNPPGTPVDTQVYGDCKQRECDASGAITEVEVESDFYDWGNPCYLDGCNAWMLPPQAAGPESCTTKWGKLASCIGLLCIQCMDDNQCPGAQCVEEIGKCVPLHCSNGGQDMANGETDVDCGGPCAPCKVGMKCALRVDCEGEGQCIANPVGSPKTCQTPTCSDSVKSNDETDEDCGGNCAEDVANPKKCGLDKGCHVPNDCNDGLSCKNGKCTP